jgi:uncharacterized alkaline shock family protein YloU
MSEEQPQGKIEVSQDVVAELAGRAAVQCYGVVGMASRHLRDGIAELLHQKNFNRGVDVKLENGKITIELYVIVEYGTRIVEVANSMMSSVKFAVEQALGVPVAQVNVNVQGLHMSE